ncbi:MAG: glycosyl hydrolase family 79 C-terminal domain-containing protein, partial [Bryocella sp.]
KNTIITHSNLKQFAEFLNKTGWSAIWSVNFAQGTIKQAVQEARAVSDILGPRLLALEIGNEVDAYGRSQPFRSPSYNYETYRSEYSEWHSAIAKAIPKSRFAAPDTTLSGLEWVEHMAQDAKGEVQLLATHYYRNGQRSGNAEQLLLPDPRLKNILDRLHVASKKSGIPWRMCEINSFSGGGLPGVSDTFVGALWTLNIMLLLAQSGCSGVNMETGVNQLGFVSSYSPIQDNGKGINFAGVPYYGMLAFATAFAGCHQMLRLEADHQSDFLTTFAFGSAGKARSIVVVNTDAAKEAHLSVEGLGMGRGSVLRLRAPSADSKTGVSFGDAVVDESGRWRSQSNERLQGTDLVIPHMSAAVLLADVPT